MPDYIDPIGHGFEHVLQELSGSLSVSRCNELSGGKLGRSIDAHKEIEPALCSLHFGNVDMKKANGAALELLALWFVSLDIQQPRNPMPRQTAMQR